MIQSRISERVALVSRIAPQSIEATSVTSAYVSPSVLGKFGRLIAIAQTGENSTGNVTVSLVKASDGSGSSAEVFDGASVLVAAAGDHQDIMLNFDVNAVDAAKPYVALRITVSASTCLVAGSILAADGRYDPASDHNADSVSEVVG